MAIWNFMCCETSKWGHLKQWGLYKLQFKGATQTKGIDRESSTQGWKLNSWNEWVSLQRMSKNAQHSYNVTETIRKSCLGSRDVAREGEGAEGVWCHKDKRKRSCGQWSEHSFQNLSKGAGQDGHRDLPARLFQYCL